MGKLITVDQLNNQLEFEQTPCRIVSLVPSQTELLFDLGLNNEVIGITKFCIHPNEWFKTKTRVGGTKQLDIEKIRSLKPDLIIANKEENEKTQIEQLQKEFPVWISDIKTLDDAYNMILNVGELVNKEDLALDLVKKVKGKFNLLRTKNKELRTLYFIWQKPYMTAGKNTFIDHLMKKVGLINIATPADGRYPEYTIDQIKSLVPEAILLSSEPFPFNEKHKTEFEKLLPNTRIVLVDGEMFSWYGSRLLKTPEYLKNLINQFK